MDKTPGSYALIFEAGRPFSAEIGKLGQFTGKPGCYIYCGSAFGPGGVAARIKHHTRPVKRPHWHIDYLRRALTLVDIWYCFDPANREHDWSRIFSGYGSALIPKPGFGSSDCDCTSHLIYLRNTPSITGFRRKLKQALAGHWADDAGHPALRM